MCLIYFGAKCPFDVDINESADPFKWILKYEEGGGQYNNLEPYDPLVKVGRVGRFGATAPYHLPGCQVSINPIG
jgi:hypothetical protein